MSKQERVVCAAVRSRIGGEEHITLFVNHPVVQDHEKVVISLIEYEKGFITNKNRFVDPVEAMRISVNNKNRIDYEVSGEMDRLRKDLAKATASRNRGTIEVEVGLKLLEGKYFGLESVLNEFRGRNHLKPEDLY